jgi:hypothetical protein
MARVNGRRGLVLLLAFIGLVAGFVSYAGIQRSTSSSASRELADLLPGTLIIFSGSWDLFSRAAFPHRYTAHGRLRLAVISAAGILAGCGLILQHGLAVPLGAIALTLMTLAALGFPKRIFEPTG